MVNGPDNLWWRFGYISSDPSNEKDTYLNAT